MDAKNPKPVHAPSNGADVSKMSYSQCLDGRILVEAKRGGLTGNIVLLHEGDDMWRLEMRQACSESREELIWC